MPFYLNGRPGQRALVLRWLDESYGSKEPVKYDSLTIEHVLPQTPTPGGGTRSANLWPETRPSPNFMARWCTPSAT